jgi:DNA-directed RNA polymerase specialized sigma24 family protein
MERAAAASADAEERMVQREREQVLEEALSELREKAPQCHDLVVAHELEGETMADLARRQAIPYGTGCTRLRRGREELKEFVARWRAKHEPGARRGGV